MKIYIDLAKQAITNTTDEKVYEGDFYSNVFEVLFYNYEDENWFPTMSQLAPNGRKAGDFTADALGVGESHTYVEDGKTYLRFTFTMGATWVLMKGRSNFYIWLNRLNGTVLKKCVGMVNVMIDQSTDNYFIADVTFNPSVKAYIDNEIEADMEEYAETVNASIEAQNEAIDNLLGGTPQVFDTASAIGNLQENKGIAVATDTGYIYVWNETGYESTGIKYLVDVNYEALEDATVVIDTKNLCPTEKAHTTNDGHINNATGQFGTVETSKTYTFSADVYKKETAGNINIRIVADNQIKQTVSFDISVPAETVTRKSVTFTTTSAGTIYLNGYWGSGNGNIDLLSNIQLELGSVATTYVPYQAMILKNQSQVDELEDIVDEITETNDINLCPLDKVTTNAEGYLNTSSGKLMDVIANTTYTFSADCYKNASYLADIQLRVYVDGTKENEFICETRNIPAQTTTRIYLTFKPTVSGGLYLNSYQGSSNANLDILTNIQIELGSEATRYYPYQAIYPKGVIDLQNEVDKMVNQFEVNSNMLSIAHQGGVWSGYYPNTIPNFIQAKLHGYSGIETDARVTSDGVIVISHDNVRTDVNNVQVTISETTYENLMSHQFYADASITIPTLEETIKICKVYGLVLDLEFKISDYQQCVDCYNLIKKYDYLDYTILSSFQTGNLSDMVTNGYTDVKYVFNINGLIDFSNLDETFVARVNNVKNNSKGLYIAVDTNDNPSDTYFNNVRNLGAYIIGGFFETTVIYDTYLYKYDIVASETMSLNYYLRKKLN